MRLGSWLARAWHSSKGFSSCGNFVAKKSSVLALIASVAGGLNCTDTHSYAFHTYHGQQPLYTHNTNQIPTEPLRIEI